jgi:glycosyltransferase involved in cell wall biosynthesis
VASDLPALREVLTPDNVLLVTPDSSEALTTAFARLLADEPLRSRLAAQARQDVATYTWAARAKSILQFAESKAQ